MKKTYLLIAIIVLMTISCKDKKNEIIENYFIYFKVFFNPVKNSK